MRRWNSFGSVLFELLVAVGLITGVAQSARRFQWAEYGRPNNVCGEKNLPARFDPGEVDPAKNALAHWRRDACKSPVRGCSAYPTGRCFVGLGSAAQYSISANASLERPPTAHLTAAPPAGPVPLNVRFDASKSGTNGAEIVAWRWRFGDGSTGTGRTVVHAYRLSGEYHVLLTVTDSRGRTAKATAVVRAFELVIDPDRPRPSRFVPSGMKLRACADARGGHEWYSAGKGRPRAIFRPGVEGRYDVFLFWHARPELTWRAVCTVASHRHGDTRLFFDQSTGAGWCFLGSFELTEKSSIVIATFRDPDMPIVADAVGLMPTRPRIVEELAKDTITPVTLNCGDTLRFHLRNGAVRELKVLRTGAARTGKDDYQYRFYCEITIDGKPFRLRRVVPAQESFCQPFEYRGLRVFFDAVSDIFVDDGGFMRVRPDDVERGHSCLPSRKVRLAVNDVHDAICPQPLHEWYRNDDKRILVSECYHGRDTWMGPYTRTDAHVGLDINMPARTPLYAPIDFDTHFLFDSVAAGDSNNRWRGVRRWPNGSIWWLPAHHVDKMLVAERTPLACGTKYCLSGGTAYGRYTHTHFMFRIFEDGESHWLDPWILFWQMWHGPRGRP